MSVLRSKSLRRLASLSSLRSSTAKSPSRDRSSRDSSIFFGDDHHHLHDPDAPPVPALPLEHRASPDPGSVVVPSDESGSQWALVPATVAGAGGEETRRRSQTQGRKDGGALPAWDRLVDVTVGGGGGSGDEDVVASFIAHAERHIDLLVSQDRIAHFDSPLLWLPSTIRHRIWRHVVTSTSTYSPEKAVRLNTPCFLSPVWDPSKFQTLSTLLRPFHSLLNTCTITRHEILVVLLSTHRFHAVVSPYTRGLVSAPLVTCWLPRYGGMLRDVTLEVDCSKQAFGPEPEAVGMDPEQGVVRMRALVKAFVRGLVRDDERSARGRPKGEKVGRVTVLCRRFAGDRPKVLPVVEEEEEVLNGLAEKFPEYVDPMEEQPVVPYFPTVYFHQLFTEPLTMARSKGRKKAADIDPRHPLAFELLMIAEEESVAKAPFTEEAPVAENEPITESISDPFLEQEPAPCTPTQRPASPHTPPCQTGGGVGACSPEKSERTMSFSSALESPTPHASPPEDPPLRDPSPDRLSKDSNAPSLQLQQSSIHSEAASTDPFTTTDQPSTPSPPPATPTLQTTLTFTTPQTATPELDSHRKLPNRPVHRLPPPPPPPSTPLLRDRVAVLRLAGLDLHTTHAIVRALFPRAPPTREGTVAANAVRRGGPPGLRSTHHGARPASLVAVGVGVQPTTPGRRRAMALAAARRVFSHGGKPTAAGVAAASHGDNAACDARSRDEDAARYVWPWPPPPPPPPTAKAPAAIVSPNRLAACQPPRNSQRLSGVPSRPESGVSGTTVSTTITGTTAVTSSSGNGSTHRRSASLVPSGASRRGEMAPRQSAWYWMGQGRGVVRYGEAVDGGEEEETVLGESGGARGVSSGGEWAVNGASSGEDGRRTTEWEWWI